VPCHGEGFPRMHRSRCLYVVIMIHGESKGGDPIDLAIKGSSRVVFTLFRDATWTANPVQITAFFGLIAGVSGSAVDAGNPLQYGGFPSAFALGSAG